MKANQTYIIVINPIKHTLRVGILYFFSLKKCSFPLSITFLLAIPRSDDIQQYLIFNNKIKSISLVLSVGIQIGFSQSHTVNIQCVLFCLEHSPYIKKATLLQKPIFRMR